MKRPEQQLHITVADYLRLQYPQLLWFHPNNTLPMTKQRAARVGGIMKRMGVRAGVSDLLLFWRGGKGAIELKAPKGTQTDTQKLFQSQWVHTGGQYAICRSLDEVIAVLRGWGVDGVKHIPSAIAEGGEPDSRCKPAKERFEMEMV